MLNASIARLQLKPSELAPLETTSISSNATWTAGQRILDRSQSAHVSPSNFGNCQTASIRLCASTSTKMTDENPAGCTILQHEPSIQHTHPLPASYLHSASLKQRHPAESEDCNFGSSKLHWHCSIAPPPMSVLRPPAPTFSQELCRRGEYKSHRWYTRDISH